MGLADHRLFHSILVPWNKFYISHLLLCNRLLQTQCSKTRIMYYLSQLGGSGIRDWLLWVVAQGLSWGWPGLPSLEGLTGAEDPLPKLLTHLPGYGWDAPAALHMSLSAELLEYPYSMAADLCWREQSKGPRCHAFSDSASEITHCHLCFI